MLTHRGNALKWRAPVDVIGTTLGRYRDRVMLGAGGMVSLSRLRHRARPAGRDKVLGSDLNQDHRRRLLHEARVGVGS